MSKGFSGRSHSESAWYRRKVAVARRTAEPAETGIASVWSWGWGQWTASEQDPAKSYALCAWLWTRSPTLCNAPKAIGTDFDPSRETGQLSTLAAGDQCVMKDKVLSNDAIQRLQLVTGERDTAYSALYERLIERGRVPVPGPAGPAARRAVIAQEFKEAAAYLAACGARHVDIARACSAIAPAAKLEATLSAGNPRRRR